MDDHTIEKMKYIWSVMLEYGVITDENYSWSYYGGDFDSPHDSTESIHNYIKQIGVNWYQTDIPEYESRNEFVGTDCPSDNVDVWLGKIVLNDGSKYYIGAKNIDIQYLIDELKYNKNPDELISKYF